MLDDPRLSLFMYTALLLVTGGILGMMLERWLANQRRRAWKDRNRRRWPSAWPARQRWSGTQSSDIAPSPQSQPAATKIMDAADQLRVVMAAEFQAQALLNRSEARVFRELDQNVLANNPGWQVMAQVSLGEILSCDNSAAYGCINSKRVDLLLVDEDCQPRHVLEYQGSGHYLTDAAARDAVKREALRRAGIGYHEVVAGHTTPSDLKRLVEKLVDKPGSVPVSSSQPD